MSRLHFKVTPPKYTHTHTQPRVRNFFLNKLASAFRSLRSFHPRSEASVGGRAAVRHAQGKARDSGVVLGGDTKDLTWEISPAGLAVT